MSINRLDYPSDEAFQKAVKEAMEQLPKELKVDHWTNNGVPRWEIIACEDEFEVVYASIYDVFLKDLIVEMLTSRGHVVTFNG